MSDEPKVIDLRQASVSRLLEHLGDLVEAIKVSNRRYVSQEREIGEMHTKIDEMMIALTRLTTEMREGFRDVRSDLVLMENRLLSAEHGIVTTPERRD
jgi:hypothetical protein